jgi:hypothetical protein
MRTTAVYGSGKFGAADHNAMAGRPLMDGPFRVEMLAVWLIRAFVADLVEHMAACRAAVSGPCASPRSAPRAGHRQRHRPRHGALPRQPPRSPEQLDHRAGDGDRPRPRPASGPAAQRDGFAAALAMAQVAAAGWRSNDPVQSAAWDALRGISWASADHVEAGALDGERPWDALIRWAEEALSLEGQEACAALILEPHGAWSTTWPRPWAPMS